MGSVSDCKSSIENTEQRCAWVGCWELDHLTEHDESEFGRGRLLHEPRHSGPKFVAQWWSPLSMAYLESGRGANQSTLWVPTSLKRAEAKFPETQREGMPRIPRKYSDENQNQLYVGEGGPVGGLGAGAARRTCRRGKYPETDR
ncbi:hypothetical protein NE237_014916 [Protea cynaroides]|uniref:Uncharacterized protein n=1 Tax=Protea cynaroides TaxID=273540 RepID=A0A9Q0QQF4_9MAGN|nr:hypothetical protein NE237_014916 [Protea cynaroides]